MPDRKQFRKEKVYLGSQFHVIIHHCWELKEAGLGAVAYIHSQEQSENKHLLLLSTLSPLRFDIRPKLESVVADIQRGPSLLKSVSLDSPPQTCPDACLHGLYSLSLTLSSWVRFYIVSK